MWEIDRICSFYYNSIWGLMDTSSAIWYNLTLTKAIDKWRVLSIPQSFWFEIIDWWKGIIQDICINGARWVVVGGHSLVEIWFLRKGFSYKGGNAGRVCEHFVFSLQHTSYDHKQQNLKKLTLFTFMISKVKIDLLNEFSIPPLKWNTRFYFHIFKSC